MNKLLVYWKIWQVIAINALQEAFVNRWSNALFFLGKAIRLGMMLLFLVLLKSRDISVGSYSSEQVVVFFLVYQLMDTVGQVFYRGVYLFGNLIRTGEFDFFLSKPVNPLFRSLTGKPDVNDAFFLVPFFAISAWLLSSSNINLNASSVLLSLVLMINGFLIVTAFHIFVLAFGVLTTEVDNLIWTYRDISRLGQFPVSMYLAPLRLALFFLVPIGFMVTVPAEVLLSEQPSYSVLVAFASGLLFFWLSLRTWRWSLQRYSSASS